MMNKSYTIEINGELDHVSGSLRGALAYIEGRCELDPETLTGNILYPSLERLINKYWHHDMQIQGNTVVIKAWNVVH